MKFFRSLYGPVSPLEADAGSDLYVPWAGALRGLQSGDDAEAGGAVIDIHIGSFIVAMVKDVRRLRALTPRRGPRKATA